MRLALENVFLVVFRRYVPEKSAIPIKKCCNVDQFDNLTYVIPPKVTTADGVSATEMSELCYQYKYDYRNRLIEKKIPGKGDANTFESIVYNKLDQPILTQDPLLKAESAWLFTKYDALGRVAYTGKITDARDRGVIQEEATAYNGDLWVSKTTTGIRYDDGGYPKVTTGETLTINYYDDYNFDIAGLASPGTVSGEAITNRTRSLPTGSKVKVLGEDQWITTVTYYDNKARAIYVASKNEYLNTTDIVESELDFVGKVLKTTSKHKKGSNAQIVTVDTFTYDHMGRATKQTQKIDAQAEEVITENTYDALGQLIKKTVGGGLQDVNYSYNVRGWMTGINDVNTLGTDLFSFKINYNTTEHGAKGLYNGKISETEWRTANDNIKRWYSYDFDAFDRILNATSGTGNYNLSNVKYDKIGNILSLNRKGHINSAANSFGDMDKLVYTYDIGSKLLKVSDNGNKTIGFMDGSNINDDFAYNANGAIIFDRNKGITNITYNHLDLPIEIKFNNSNSKKINYVYDASGKKLKKIVTDGNTITTKEYTQGGEYKNGVLQYINHSEGYLEPNGNDWLYVYQYKDNLGNIRLNYADSDGNGSITTSEIREEKAYYPFGMQLRGFNSAILGRKHNFGFGGKEFSGEFDLNTYDFGARNYMPDIGRWGVIDALADEPEQIFRSTYQFGWNNPIYYTDPDGNCPKCWSALKAYAKGGASAVQSRVEGLVNLVTSPIETFNAAVEQSPSTFGEAVETAALNALEGHTTGKIALTVAKVIEGGLENGVEGASFAFGSELAGASIDAASSLVPGTGIATKVGGNASKVAKTAKRAGRSGKQSRLREWMNDLKASSADRGWLKNDQRHIKNGNKKALRIPRNGRKSPGRKKKDKGYELAHKNDAPASQGHGYKGSLVKNHAEHKVETRIHRNRYGKKE
ncbi:RHS repeat-associated core domain-containing protein [Aquimarina aggregata]|uniref:RHS repeat-associated core domain-containing protein n=1 Tax=Aquimarina aggregata TaxID=1642818 RepID=UPI00248FFD1A|nr:RHS repeat-associated core domain-containing protein [Aquimarina aggregata]